MATVVAEIIARLKADTSQFRSAMNEVASTVQQSQQRLASSADQMRSTGRSLTRNVTLPIVGAGAAMLKLGSDFEFSMNRLGAISGAAGADLEEMSDQAKELGRTTQFSASQAADGMNFLAMAGFEASEIIGAMPGVLDLAAAGNMDLARTADIASNVLTGFGLAAGEANRVADVMAATITSANTDMSQLGEAMKFVAPVAASAGFEIEEMSAAIGLLGNAGIQGSMAGTTMRQAIAALLDPVGDAADIISDLGLRTHDSSGSLLSMAEIVEQLAEAGATTEQILGIFGVRAGPGMAALVDQGAGALRDLTGALKESAGVAGDIASAQMEGFRGEMLKLRAALEGMAIAFAESGLLDAAARFLSFLADAATFIGGLSPGLLQLVGLIGGLAAAAGPAVVVTGSILKNLDRIKTIAPGAGTALRNLGSAAAQVAALNLVAAAARQVGDALQDLIDGDDTQVLSADIAELGKNGRVTGSVLEAWGADLNKLGEDAARIAQRGTLDVLGDGIVDFTQALPLIPGLFDPRDELVQKFEALGTELASLAAQDAPAAARAFDQIAQAMAQNGVDVDTALGLMPAYAETLDDAATAAVLAGDAAGDAGNEIDGLGNDARGAARSVDELVGALKKQRDQARRNADPVFDMISAIRDFESAEADAKQAILDFGEGSLEAEDAILGLAEAAFTLNSTIVTPGDLALAERAFDGLVSGGYIAAENMEILISQFPELLEWINRINGAEISLMVDPRVAVGSGGSTGGMTGGTAGPGGGGFIEGTDINSGRSSGRTLNVTINNPEPRATEDEVTTLRQVAFVSGFN